VVPGLKALGVHRGTRGGPGRYLGAPKAIKGQCTEKRHAGEKAKLKQGHARQGTETNLVRQKHSMMEKPSECKKWVGRFKKSAGATGGWTVGGSRPKKK